MWPLGLHRQTCYNLGRKPSRATPSRVGRRNQRFRIEGRYSTLRQRPQNIPSLILIAILALVLTWAVSDGVSARSTFQSDPVSSIPTPAPATATPTQQPTVSTRAATATPTPMATLFNTFTPVATVFNTLTPAQTPSMTPRGAETPTPSPILPEPTPILQTPAAAPLAPGFLPPPTLTNPDAFLPGRATQSPLVGPAAQPAQPAAAAAGVTPEAPAPGPAQLIDSGVVALSYLWMCCGVIVLAVAALVVMWLARRSRAR